LGSSSLAPPLPEQSQTGDVKIRPGRRPPRGRAPSTPYHQGDQTNSLPTQETTSLDNRVQGQRGKRKRIKGREARGSPVSPPTNEGGAPLPRRLPQRGSNVLELGPNNKDKIVEPESLAWKVGSPNEDPSGSMYKVPVDIVLLERPESGKQRAAEERNTERVEEALDGSDRKHTAGAYLGTRRRI
jgi:hypothetical protein